MQGNDVLCHLKRVRSLTAGVSTAEQGRAIQVQNCNLVVRRLMAFVTGVLHPEKAVSWLCPSPTPLSFVNPCGRKGRGENKAAVGSGKGFRCMYC